ncbi:membrane protein of unknown function [Nitrospira sp. KM1]|uniref:O-antigen ligase family protein n=1 Tax=Nitrospira sp. KM1 TaxID=1936990 RepID=UPI0013A748D7|nr:O-antigen ligase family protein [Nitrospira sp. KM1]BCA54201.1 membrane protein of unknown function [Nitrospira sp. KM1]
MRTVLLVYIAVLPYKKLLVLERNGFIALLALLGVWCVMNRKLFYSPTPFDHILLAFVLWVGVTIPFASFPPYSFKEYGKLLQWMVVFYATLYFLGQPPYRKWLLGLIIIPIPLIALFGLMQFRAMDPTATTSFFTSEVWLTTFLIMTIPYSLAVLVLRVPSRVKGIAALVSILAVGCLLSTQSRAGVVALVAEMGVLVWLAPSLMSRVTIVASVIIVVGVLAIGLAVKTSSIEQAAPTDSTIPVKTGVATIVHRLDIWTFTVSEIPKHWLVGIGYGGNSFMMRYGQEEEIVPAGHATVRERGTHNILLYHALHVGIPGLALYLWLYAAAVLTTARQLRSATDLLSQIVLVGGLVGMIGLFVRLQFDQMFVGSLAILFWVLFALTVMYYPVRQCGPMRSA